MEEEKAAEYYDELVRKGGNAAKFKQGLGFGTHATSVPNSEKYGSLSNFVKAASPQRAAAITNEITVDGIREKLKKRDNKSSRKSPDGARKNTGEESNGEHKRKRTSDSEREDRTNGKAVSRRKERRSRSRSRSWSRRGKGSRSTSLSLENSETYNGKKPAAKERSRSGGHSRVNRGKLSTSPSSDTGERLAAKMSFSKERRRRSRSRGRIGKDSRSPSSSPENPKISPVKKGGKKDRSRSLSRSRDNRRKVSTSPSPTDTRERSRGKERSEKRRRSRSRSRGRDNRRKFSKSPSKGSEEQRSDKHSRRKKPEKRSRRNSSLSGHSTDRSSDLTKKRRDRSSSELADSRSNRYHSRDIVSRSRRSHSRSFERRRRDRSHSSSYKRESSHRRSPFRSRDKRRSRSPSPYRNSYRDHRDRHRDRGYPERTYHRLQDSSSGRRNEPDRRDKRSPGIRRDARSEDASKSRSLRSKEGPPERDYSKIIPNFDSMTPAEKIKAKTKLQLSETVAKDQAKGMSSEWERFDFNNSAPLDDDAKLDYFGDGTGAADDTLFLKNTGSTFLSTSNQASRETHITAMHEAAIFGPPEGLSLTVTQPESNLGTQRTGHRDDTGIMESIDSITESDHKDQKDTRPPVDSVVSEQVITMQQTGSWQERARKMREARAAALAS